MHVPQTEVILQHAGTELARVTLPPGEYVIGRAPESDIHAETPLLSRQHARLTINYDHILIEDLGSSNGTFVNGQPVAEATRLYPSQPIRLGPDLTLEVHRERAAAEAGISLPPAQAAIRRHLPDELLADKRYAIGNVVARGGMGAILDARQRAIDRTVAMKVMLDSADEASVLRFIDEAKITGQLDHPNIVPIYELGVDEQDQLFYTMKMVRGITLKKVLELLAQRVEATVKKYPLPALLTIFQKACDAVAFAHSKSVIHRDLKPENIMLGDFGSVLVMDWGLAKIVGDADAPGAVLSSRTAGGESGGTVSGSIMGTPAYMAPEQARGEIEKLDARSDIYALGAILFEILHLRPAVTGNGALEIVQKVQQGEIEWDAGKSVNVPDSLLAVCRKALAFDPAARYPSVEDLQADLLAYQSGFATRAEKAGAWKQFTLFIKRHKAMATATAAAFVIVMAVVGVAFVRVTGEKNNATRALTRLRGTAPTFAAQAAALVEKRDIAEALGKIEFATSLAPDEAEYWVSKGHILESLSRLADARDAYRQALARNPAHTLAKENAEFCEAALSQENTPGQLSGDTRKKLQNLMRREGRVAEAIALLGALGKDKKAIYDTWRAALDRAGIKQQLNQGDDGLLSLDLTGANLDSLEPLRGMPLTYLSIAKTKASDLSPLTGMPLTNLDLTGCAQLRDLTPLKGMKLRIFFADGAPISDLSPLAGMPLDALLLRATKVTALEPLRGMPLRVLNLAWSPVSDLTPLRGLQLAELNLENTPVKDLSPLKGMPLKTLVLQGSRMTDLAPLAGMPLRDLNITSTPIRDLAPLRGMKLEAFAAVGTQVSDLAPLDGMPLTNLGLLSTAVRDLSPLKHSKIKILDIRDTPASDISPLRGQPIETLLCWAFRIPDLTPVQTMPLKKLLALGAKLNDLTFLKNVPLDELILEGSTITDIRGLAGMPLRILILTKTGVRDLTPLATCRKLESLAFPAECKDIEFLRSLPSLQRIDTTWSTAGGVLKTAATFWKEYDAKKSSGGK